MDSKKNLLLASNIKILLPHITFSVLYAIIILIFSFVNRNEIEMLCFLAERVLILAGIFLFTPIFAPEQIENLHEVIISKSLKYKKIIYIRYLISLFILLSIIFSFMIIFNFFALDFKNTFLNTLIISIFLGNVGFFTTRYGKNIISGYMASFGIYLFDVSYTLLYNKSLIFPPIGIINEKLMYITIITFILLFLNLLQIKNLIRNK